MNLSQVFGLAMCFLPGFAVAEIAIIVHPSASFTSLTEDQVSRIFLGKTKIFPTGDRAVPINQTSGDEITDKFNLKICKKNESQYRAYWSRLIFTGREIPPKNAGSDKEVIEQVANTPGYVGYIDTAMVNDRIKVVLTID